jgi:hypothetical protein
MEQAFILGSMACTVANYFIFNTEHSDLKIQHLWQATKDKKDKDWKVLAQ